MAKREEYEKRTEKLVMPVIEENGFELVDVEYVKEAGNWYLRAYVDKQGGITINDCELVSRYLSDRLDAEDFIDEAYTLEVSSPGLDRPLKKEKDYRRHLGDEVEVKLYAPIPVPVGPVKKKPARKNEKSKEFTGTLKAFDEKTFTIETPDMGEMVFERDKVALVRLSFDF